MSSTIGTLFNVLITSSMYILVALGFAFIFNMLGVLNLAHGAIYMLGGYITSVLGMSCGLNPWLALAIAVAGMMLVGIALERFGFRPFIGNFDAAVVVCIALSLVIQTTVNLIAGARTFTVPNFAHGVLKTSTLSISHERIVTFAVGFVIVTALIIFVKRAKVGQQMQALTQDREGAILQGIRVNRISAFACAVGCGLAAVAGSMLGAIYGLNPFMGDFVFAKMLIIVILAGAGSLGGIVLAGLVVGAMSAILPVVMDANQAEVVIVCVVIVLLLLRPQGFFGHEVAS
ncbi:MAG: branched-chain amino acid ABC transporter permease [Armatimonadetes bacterium]|nr:branched-chain amino acid ABC transporter permease [Armatimonadota bacterium]